MKLNNMPENNKETIKVQEETNIFNNIKTIINTARTNIARTVNSEMVNCYWNIGKYIYQAQGNKSRADYGTYLIKYLSEKLTKEFGKGFDITNLKKMRQFYQYFSISETVLHQFNVKSNNLTKVVNFKLSWSHYVELIKIDNINERQFYEIEAINNNWSVRELQRQYNSSLYERLLLSKDKNKVIELSKQGQIIQKPQDIIKTPFVLEFLGLEEKLSYSESDLENAIISKLQQFILELGKGFLFEARQKRFTFDNDNYYVDLVFYNRLLKCYVLIDLKANKLNYADIGQIDFYTRYFNKEVKIETDNPTIGLILCTDKNKAMVRYTLLEDKTNNIFASKYTPYLPTEEELTKYLIEQRELLEMEERYIKEDQK